MRILRSFGFFVSTIVMYLGIPLVGWGLGNLWGFFSVGQRLGYALIVLVLGVAVAWQTFTSPEGLLFLILENKLREFCEIVGKRKGKTPPAAKRDIVKQYKRFLEDAGVSIAQQVWESVHDLNKVRNCIVHASGDVARAIDKKHLRSLAHRDPSLAISGYDYEGEGLPLYLEDDMLMLTTDYCSHAVADVRRLFENLCRAVPLRGIVLEEITR